MDIVHGLNLKYKKSAWLAWVLCAVVIAGAVFSFVLSLNDPKTRTDVFAFANALLNSLFPIAFGVVGALILSRLTRNRIGWLLMSIALSIAVFGTLQNYYTQNVNGSAELTAMKILAIWLSGWGWWLLMGPVLLLLLTFPTGQLLSPRWRWVVGIIGLLVSFWIVFVTTPPIWQDPSTGKTFPNPLGVNLIPADFTFETIQVPWAITLVSTVVLCVLAVLLRYRRSGIIEREQLKWFLYVCVIFIIVYAGSAITSVGVDSPDWFGIFLSAAFVLLPVSIGIAILRYRLFDIDIIIRRTLIYSILTVILAFVYFGVVILIQQLFRFASGQVSEIAIIISTLTIAALFNPLHRRVQQVIDRRLYRRKYDAQQVLESFSAVVRDEVELEKLTARLIDVVDQTLQPTRVSLWLRESPWVDSDKTRNGNNQR